MRATTEPRLVQDTDDGELHLIPDALVMWFTDFPGRQVAVARGPYGIDRTPQSGRRFYAPATPRDDQRVWANVGYQAKVWKDLLARDWHTITLWTTPHVRSEVGLSTLIVNLLPYTRDDVRLRLGHLEPQGPGTVFDFLDGGPLTDAHREAAVSFLADLEKTEPTWISDRLHQADQVLPTRRALGQLTGWFPEASTGLTLWERRMMEFIDTRHKAGRPPPDATVLGYAQGHWGVDREEGAPCDTTLTYCLEDLAGRDARPRFVDVAEDGNGYMVTELGHAVLRGEAHRFDHQPVDLWVAGTHLSSKDNNLWVWDGEHIRRWSH